MLFRSACGTPAIVSRIAPFTEHLQPHEAFWVDPLDVDDIANALRLTLYPKQRAERAAIARQVAARFDWQACAQQHQVLYLASLAPSSHTACTSRQSAPVLPSLPLPSTAVAPTCHA